MTTLDSRSFTDRLAPERFGFVDAMTDRAELSPPELGPQRWHELHTIKYKGFKHAAIVSRPTDGKAPVLRVLSFPGRGERIEMGPRLRFQLAVAARMPWAEFYFIGTDGIGTYGDPVTDANVDEHGLEAMAHNRLGIASELPDTDLPVALLGTSMSTFIVHDMIMKNEARRRPVNIAAAVHLEPALATRAGILQAEGRFLLNASPWSFLQATGTSAEQVALHRHQMDVERGLDQNDIVAGLAAVPTAVIAGSKDYFYQTGLARLNDRLPDSLVTEIIPNTGHTLHLDPDMSATRVARHLCDLLGRN